jgi:hypothetical protein
MAFKKVGYYIVKGKCVKVYTMKKRNRTGRLVTKKVNYRGKVLKKGTKVYKTKAECVKALKRKMNKGKSTRSKGKKPVKRSKSPTYKSRSRRSKFGQKSECYYEVPYFGTMIPNISKTLSGTQDTGISSSLWKWPKQPSAKAIDMQQGRWMKVKNIN